MNYFRAIGSVALRMAQFLLEWLTHWVQWFHGNGITFFQQYVGITFKLRQYFFLALTFIRTKVEHIRNHSHNFIFLFQFQSTSAGLNGLLFSWINKYCFNGMELSESDQWNVEEKMWPNENRSRFNREYVGFDTTEINIDIQTPCWQKMSRIFIAVIVRARITRFISYRNRIILF